MKPAAAKVIRAYVWLLASLCPGCASLESAHSSPASAAPTAAATPSDPSTGNEVPPVSAPTQTSSATALPRALLEGVSELTAEALVEQVLARNPSLAQMVAAWQAASARSPQVTSLEDPTFSGTMGPGTIAPDDAGIEFAYRLEISQKLPFPGKRRLRGENARAEASAAERDVDDMRLQLIESARMAFFDYYLVDRALEVNEESLRLLRDFRSNAQARYKTGQVPEQDVLQADVEIGTEQDRRLELDQMRQVAIARINTLMHLPPDSPLPPPSKRLPEAAELPDAQTLRAAALARRPDLQALAHRIAAEEASLALAHKEFYPDFEPFFMYDRFMGNVSDNRDLATMLGLRMNLPVYKGRRYAAVAEAQARIVQRRAELARLSDQVQYQFQEAYARLQRSEKSVRLYRDTILRAAEANVKAAQSAYLTGKVPFLSLIEAQRNLVGLRDRYYEVLANYCRRRGALERAAGGPLTPPLPGCDPAAWTER